MSALAEALVAAQRRALTGMEKQFVAGKITEQECRDVMNGMGLTEAVDQDRLMWALAAIQTYGAALPTEPTSGGEPKPPEPASDAQLALIAKLVTEKHLQAPDLPLTKTDASAIITSMQQGSYDASKWSVPF